MYIWPEGWVVKFLSWPLGCNTTSILPLNLSCFGWIHFWSCSFIAGQPSLYANSYPWTSLQSHILYITLTPLCFHSVTPHQQIPQPTVNISCFDWVHIYMLLGKHSHISTSHLGSFILAHPDIPFVLACLSFSSHLPQVPKLSLHCQCLNSCS